MKHILITSLALLLLSGCAGTQKGRTIEGLSTHTGAAMSTYATKTAPIAADKVLITDTEASNATKNVTLGSIQNAWDWLTLSATSPLSLNTTTGELTLTKGSVFDTQAHLEAWLGWSFPSGGSTSLSGISDWPSGVSATEVGYLDGVTSGIQAQINSIVAGSSGYISTAPTYSNDTCTKGTFSVDSSYFYTCKATNTWDRVTLGAWSNPAYTLTITQPTGGTIACSDADLSQAISCGSTCTARAASGASITGCTATADSGYDFTAWSGNLSGSAYNDGSVTMSADKVGSATFTAWVTTPNNTLPWFSDEIGVPLNAVKTSNSITVAGINHPAAISVNGDTGYGYAKNGGGCTNTSGTVSAGDTVAACVTSSGSNSTPTNATVTIGGISDEYRVTTLAGGNFDNFTDTDGTTLATHNGGVWSAGGGGTITNGRIGSGQVYGLSGTGFTARYPTSTSDTSQITFKAQTNATTAVIKKVFVRSSLSTAGYTANLGTISSSNYTTVTINGNGSFIGQCAVSVSTTSDHTIKIKAAGTNPVDIDVYIDSDTVTCHKSTTTNLIESGNPGFSLQTTADSNDGYFDNWQDY